MTHRDVEEAKSRRPSRAAADRSLAAFYDGLQSAEPPPKRKPPKLFIGGAAAACAILGALIIVPGDFNLPQPGENDEPEDVEEIEEDENDVEENEQDPEMEYSETEDIELDRAYNPHNKSFGNVGSSFQEWQNYLIPLSWDDAGSMQNEFTVINRYENNDNWMEIQLFSKEADQEVFDEYLSEVLERVNGNEELLVNGEQVLDQIITHEANLFDNNSEIAKQHKDRLKKSDIQGLEVYTFKDPDNNKFLEVYTGSIYHTPFILSSSFELDRSENWQNSWITLSSLAKHEDYAAVPLINDTNYTTNFDRLEEAVINFNGYNADFSPEVKLHYFDELDMHTYIPADAKVHKEEYDHSIIWYINYVYNGEEEEIFHGTFKKGSTFDEIKDELNEVLPDVKGSEDNFQTVGKGAVKREYSLVREAKEELSEPRFLNILLQMREYEEMKADEVPK
ncbi:hypothetical protein [Alkalicoccus urumqiensis]|uniref:Uncharacterized protein n=1 Tax=Alkalicoccus urumqiensis TaxID=1548213 RepID=A0A2P6MJ64_ALKUR|nr:hypothetical protein [Alkalicoccus urumqiensis]PRO66322.1 hypothetical protein C6I21_05830 [Alkalicoccus urumqiensis]